MNDPHFTVPIAQHIWDTKYTKYRHYERGVALDTCVEDTWQRVAKALAVPENNADDWVACFYSILCDLNFFLAGGFRRGRGLRIM
jgi:ribonucleoside-diphosphate reductase alpha chain